MKHFSAENYINSLSYNLYYFFSSLAEITTANYNDVFNKFTEAVIDTINKHAPVKNSLARNANFYKSLCLLKE